MSWFRQKTRGYGGYPANWKGWVAIASFIVAEAAIAWWYVVQYVVAGETVPFGAGTNAGITAALVAVVAFFLFYKKTDGKFRWRWGDRS